MNLFTISCVYLLKSTKVWKIFKKMIRKWKKNRIKIQLVLNDLVCESNENLRRKNRKENFMFCKRKKEHARLKDKKKAFPITWVRMYVVKKNRSKHVGIYLFIKSVQKIYTHQKKQINQPIKQRHIYKCIYYAWTTHTRLLVKVRLCIKKN